jgi:hypothetical protein
MVFNLINIDVYDDVCYYDNQNIIYDPKEKNMDEYTWWFWRIFNKLKMPNEKSKKKQDYTVECQINVSGSVKKIKDNIFIELGEIKIRLSQKKTQKAIRQIINSMNMIHRITEKMFKGSIYCDGYIYYSYSIEPITERDQIYMGEVPVDIHVIKLKNGSTGGRIH